MKPKTVTEKYIIESKILDASGRIHHIAHIKTTGETKSFETHWRAEFWAMASTGTPLIADDAHALKSNIRYIIEADGYSQPSAILNDRNPVAIYRDEINGIQKVFRIYRHADDSSSTGETWQVEIDMPSKTGEDTLARKVWEGESPPSRVDIIAALRQ